jgi:hypothetical protein
MVNTVEPARFSGRTIPYNRLITQWMLPYAKRLSAQSGTLREPPQACHGD